MSDPTPLVEREPFIPYADPTPESPFLREVLAKYLERMGFYPNALLFYLHRPDIADPLWRLNSAIMRDASSTLPQGLKRRVSAACSKANGCKYCTTHHCEVLKNPGGFAAEGWDMPADELRALLDGEPEATNEMEQVCFDFALAASYDPTNVPDEIYDRLKKHLTPPQIVELAAVVGFWKMYNTIHDILRVPLEQHLLELSKTVDINTPA